MRTLAACVAGVVALGLSVAHADRRSEREARALFREGNRLFDKGDFVGALELFRDAHDRFPSPKILLNTGATLVKLGRYAEAIETYEAYLSDPKADAGRRPDVEKILADIRPLAGRVRVAVAPEDAVVRVDGKPVTGGAERSRYVDPGEHTVVAEKEGMKRAVSAVTVRAGEEKRVSIELAPATTAAAAVETGPATGPAIRPVEPESPPAGGPPPAGPSSPPPSGAAATTVAVDQVVVGAGATSPPRPGRTRRIAGLSLAGAGVAAIAAGTVFGLVARSRWNEVQDRCTPVGDAYECGPEDIGLRDSIDTATTVADVAFGIGIPAVVAGVVLYLTAPSAQGEKPRTSLRVTPSVDRGVGLVFSGAY